MSSSVAASTSRPDAISNYTQSIRSIPSSLNMSYLDGLGQRNPATRDDLVGIARSHALGSILKQLGYTYIHLESGFIATDNSPIADISVAFTPAGTIVDKGMKSSREHDAESDKLIVSGAFIRALLQTTALQPLVGHRFLRGESAPYDFYSPRRTIDMFGFQPIQSM